MITKTLSPENQLKIVCPIFNAETRIAGCFVLRDMVWRGDGPPDKRQGCQCAMIAGKCPIPVILTKMIRLKDDPYHSAEPKLGKIDDDILDRIAPVLVMDSTMRRFAISPNEEKALVQANEDARSGARQVRKSPRKPERIIEDVPAETPRASREAVAIVSQTDALVEAAKSGDMSAAINSTGEAA